MKMIKYLFIAILSIAFLQCTQTPNGLQLSGDIQGINDNVIYFETSAFNEANESMERTELSEDGAFSFHLEEHPGPGTYRFRTGGRHAKLILDGTETSIKINAQNASNLSRNLFDIEGSSSTQAYNDIMRAQQAKKLDMKAIEKFINETEYPYAAQTYAGVYLKNRPEFVQLHTVILSKLKEKYPSADHKTYAAFVNQLVKTSQSKRNKEKIKVGQKAPDIAMPDINGKTRKLSDLKGKVVLVDFWASWCMPCRRANPHVVEMYHKYKDQGFDVFSVSLDGLDEYSKQKMRLSDNAYAGQITKSKTRWLDAIKKDKLAWDNHVSELKKWDTPSVREYGVSGIPKTFLIDREGNIAAVNPRFNLEEAIAKAL